MNRSTDFTLPADLLQESTRTGWWHGDFSSQTFYFSSYAARVLGADQWSFADFRQAIHPDMRVSVLSRIESMLLENHNFYEEKVLLNTPEGYVWARMKTVKLEVLQDGKDCFEGYIQFIEGKEGRNAEPDVSTLQLNRLLNWQRSLTQNLLGLLDETDNDQVIQNLLHDILENFRASYVSIYAIDYAKSTFSCIYESTADGVTSYKDSSQNLTFTPDTYWFREISNKHPLFVNNLNDIRQYPGSRHESLSTRGIGAVMAAPLVSGRGVWGLIKVDVLGSRMWSHVDRESFLAVVNVVGACLELSRSEKEAKLNAQNLESLFRNMPMGYFRLKVNLTPDGKVFNYDYIDVNNKFADMMHRTPDSLVGKTHLEVGPIFVDKLPLEVLGDVAYRGRIHETRGQFITDGRYYNTLLYSPAAGDVVALFTDVTPLLELTEALSRSEQELKKIYTNIPLGIEIYDKDGFMIDVNEQEVEIQAVSGREALLGLNLFEHPSLPKYAADLLREGKDVTFDLDMENLKVNVEYYGVDRENFVKYLTIKCNVIYNSAGEVENYLLIVIDNTQMYETSARLREFESDFNAAARFAEVGFFRWNLLQGTYFYTDQWFRNMGLKRETDAVTDLASYAHVIHPDDVVVLTNFLDAVHEGREDSLKYEFRVKDGDGWKWLRTMCRVTEHNSDNGILEIVGINDNITELKLTESRLIDARRKAEESDELKSAFLANMSHEIRTPLNAIVGFSSILLETESEEERRQYMSIIEKNNEHLLQLISDILDLSKIEAGTMEISIGEIDVAEICHQVVNSLVIKAQKGVEMAFVTDPEQEVTISSDAKRLTQVLSNFVTNAAKFTREGHIHLGFQLRDDEIEFWVEDTGIGMTPEQSARVFERFVKHNDFIPGTGLGLPICQSIVHQLGGKIGVTSEKGAGSRFWFTLPLK